MGTRAWPRHEIVRAAFMAGEGRTASAIADALGRSADAVDAALRREGITCSGGRVGVVFKTRVSRETWDQIRALATRNDEPAEWLAGMLLDHVPHAELGRLAAKACDLGEGGAHVRR